VTWWAWLIVWVVLVLSAALVLFLATRRLYRQGMALAAELAAAADAFTEVTTVMQAGAETRGQAPARRTP
jgi:hypothetical protein